MQTHKDHVRPFVTSPRPSPSPVTTSYARQVIPKGLSSSRSNRPQETLYNKNDGLVVDVCDAVKVTTNLQTLDAGLKNSAGYREKNESSPRSQANQDRQRTQGLTDLPRPALDCSADHTVSTVSDRLSRSDNKREIVENCITRVFVKGSTVTIDTIHTTVKDARAVSSSPRTTESRSSGQSKQWQRDCDEDRMEKSEIALSASEPDTIVKHGKMIGRDDCLASGRDQRNACAVAELPRRNFEYTALSSQLPSPSKSRPSVMLSPPRGCTVGSQKREGLSQKQTEANGERAKQDPPTVSGRLISISNKSPRDTLEADEREKTQLSARSTTAEVDESAVLRCYVTSEEENHDLTLNHDLSSSWSTSDYGSLSLGWHSQDYGYHSSELASLGDAVPRKSTPRPSHHTQEKLIETCRTGMLGQSGRPATAKKNQEHFTQRFSSPRQDKADHISDRLEKTSVATHSFDGSGKEELAKSQIIKDVLSLSETDGCMSVLDSTSSQPAQFRSPRPSRYDSSETTPPAGNEIESKGEEVVHQAVYEAVHSKVHIPRASIARKDSWICKFVCLFLVVILYLLFCFTFHFALLYLVLFCVLHCCLLFYFVLF